MPGPKVVSEADLPTAQDRRLREAQLEAGGHLRRHAEARKHHGLAAAELMTAPALTIHPGAPLPPAARVMTSRHVRRLPVVQAGTAFGGGVGGKLIGIVSRRDLLGVFLRPDEDIAGDLREMMAQLPQAEPDDVTITVHNGIVTLTGLLGSAEEHDLIRVAGRLACPQKTSPTRPDPARPADRRKARITAANHPSRLDQRGQC